MQNAILFCDTTTAIAAPTTTTVEVQPVDNPVAAAADKPANNLWRDTPILPIVLMIAIFYFMMIRPQQRKEKERRKMIENLRAGAKIVFAGGLMGTIQEAAEKTFKVEIAPGTVIEIARSSVSGVVEG